jgi:hypothetical protein
VRELPGVQSAALAAMVPLGGGGLGLGGLTVPGVQPADGSALLRRRLERRDPGYFAAMKMTLASGRDFTDADREGTPPVVIVNETAAAPMVAQSGCRRKNSAAAGGAARHARSCQKRSR